MRGIGEICPNNAATHVVLSGELDENNLPRAFVSVHPSAEDDQLWNAMDQAAEDVALVFANGQPYEVLAGAGFQPVAAGQSALTVSPRQDRRDGLGTTHHEAGTLAIGEDPDSSQ